MTRPSRRPGVTSDGILRHSRIDARSIEPNGLTLFFGTNRLVFFGFL